MQPTLHPHAALRWLAVAALAFAFALACLPPAGLYAL